MLNHSKEISIQQWFNTLSPQANVQSVSQFSNGSDFLELIKLIEPESTEEGESSETSGESPSEVALRFQTVKKFIDGHYHLDSQAFINYTECAAGKELELAKVAVMLLSALVKKYLSFEDPLVETLSHLESNVQEEIKEMMILVFNQKCDDGSLTDAEFNKALGKATKHRESNRRSTRAISSEKEDAPEHPSKAPRKYKSRSQLLTVEEVPPSPVKMYLNSPIMQQQAALFKNKAELRRLSLLLHSQEKENFDLQLEATSMKEELIKSQTECEKLKSTVTDLQNNLDEINITMRNQDEEIKKEKERFAETIQELKERIKILEKDKNEIFRRNAELEKECMRKENTANSELHLAQQRASDLELQLEQNKEICASQRQQLDEKKNELHQYEEMRLEAEKTKKAINEERNEILLEHSREIRRKDSEIQKLHRGGEKVGSELTKALSEIAIYKKWLNFGTSGDICRKCVKLQEDVKNPIQETTIGSLWNTFYETPSASAETKCNRAPKRGIAVNCTQRDLIKMKSLAADLLKSVCSSPTEETEEMKKLSSFQNFDASTSIVDFFKMAVDAISSCLSVYISSPGTKRKSRNALIEGLNDVGKLKNIIYGLEAEKTKMVKETLDLKGQQSSLSQLLEEKKGELKRASEKFAEISESKTKLDEKITEMEKLLSLKKMGMMSSKNTINMLVQQKEVVESKLTEVLLENKKLTTLINRTNSMDYKELQQRVDDLEEEKNRFYKDMAEMEHKIQKFDYDNKNLKKKLRVESEKNSNLQLEIKKHNGFRFGNIVDRQDVIDHYMKIANEKLKLKAQNQDSDERNSKCQASRISMDIGNESVNINFDKSVRSNFCQADDEEDFLNHSSLSEIRQMEHNPQDRLREIQRRNTLCLPHLQSSYPMELQNMTPSEKKYFQAKLIAENSDSDEEYIRTNPESFTKPNVDDSEIKKKMKISDGKTFLTSSMVRSPRRSSIMSRSFKTSRNIRDLVRRRRAIKPE